MMRVINIEIAPSTFNKRKNWAKAVSTGLKLTLNKLFWEKHMKISINKNISTS